MSSIYRSIQQLGSTRQQDQSQRSILSAIEEYQQGCVSDEEAAAIWQPNELSFNEFANKKTVKIKPVNMFKDLISLQRENEEKKQKIRTLETLNQQLKIQYDQCIKHNQQLQAFLKEVQFTFQPERKKPQTSEVLLKAKRTLHEEARQAQQKMKKMFKNTEASNIQEAKMYISTLENHKEQLKKAVNKLKNTVTAKQVQQDFNFLQTKKFEKACKKVRELLDNQTQAISKRHDQYRVQKMVIKGKVKSRNLQAEKNNLKDLTESYKKMLLEFEGLQYEIGLLKHRIKDRKKENTQYEQLLEKIKMKESNIIRLEKELRQKKKTFEYMHQWSRQLKKQLEDRKSEHAKKKAEYQSQINALTADYQKVSQSYKAGLFEQQVAKRKGPKDQEMLNVVKQPLLGKQVAFQEIRQIVKTLSYQLLDAECPTKQFIDSLLVLRQTVLWQGEKDGRKTKNNRNLLLVDANQSKDAITLQNLINNFQASRVHSLAKEQYVKIARFAIEDGCGRADLLTYTSLVVVRQVLNKLLQRQIQDKTDMRAAGQGLKKLLKSKGADMRHDLKLLGARSEDIDMVSVSRIIGKYCNQPFSCNLFSEFIEFYSWRKRKVVGWTTFEDYEQIVSLLNRQQVERLEE